MNWPKKDNDKEKYKDTDNDKDKLLTNNISDTDYYSDNWEPEFMTIFVTWQLRVTLDSIRNSCDVFLLKDGFPLAILLLTEKFLIGPCL